MPVDPNSIMEVRIGYVVNEQQCYNVLHYYVVAGVGGGDDERGWQGRFNTWLVGNIDTDGFLLKEMRDFMSEHAVINEVASQLIYPDRYRSSKVFPSDDNTGLVVAVCNAQNVQASISKFGELGNPNNVGAMHIGGLPVSAYEDGMLTAGALTQLDAIKAQLFDLFSVTIGGDTTTWGLGILNKEPIPGSNPVRYQIAGITPVVEAESQPQLRVMRRRTKGVGI